VVLRRTSCNQGSRLRATDFFEKMAWPWRCSPYIHRLNFGFYDRVAMPTKREEIAEAARIYGERSFDNYAQIRSIAENIRDGLCAYLDPEDGPCVYLVPPQGGFSAQNYRSGAFSVTGKGVLPLEPISFGLAVRISGEGDYMRLVLTCRKEGDKMYVSIEQAENYELDLPASDENLSGLFESLYQHLLRWFEQRVETYDNGNYGSNEIGFNIYRVDED